MRLGGRGPTVIASVSIPRNAVPNTATDHQEDSMTFTVTSITPTVGGEVVGLTGQDLVDPARASTWLAELAKHGVLVFRGVGVTDQELLALSRLLGEVAEGRTGEHEHPEISTITLDPAKTDAVLAWYRQGNFLWHIDGATEALPQKATLLTAQEVDETDGDTEFASTYAAFAALAESKRIGSPTCGSSTASPTPRGSPILTHRTTSKRAGSGSRPGCTRSCGLTGTAESHFCSAPPQLVWSAGRTTRGGRSSTACSSGRPGTSSRFDITGTGGTW